MILVFFFKKKNRTNFCKNLQNFNVLKKKKRQGGFLARCHKTLYLKVSVTKTMEGTHMWVRLINFYFEIGLKYKEIRFKSALNTRHSVQVSKRHLKGVIYERGLSRRKTSSDLVDLVEFISIQLQSSGQHEG